MGEVRPRLGVEIQPELVGELWSGGEIRPHMKAETPEVHRPRYVREVGSDESARLGSVRRGDNRRFQPRRCRAGYSLLIEGRSHRPRGETLQEQGTATHRSHYGLFESQVMVDEIELGFPTLRKEDLCGTRDPDLPVLDHEGFLVALHRRG